MDRGMPSLTIDEIPLEWCFGDGVVLDFRHKADGDRITVGDVEKELKRIKYEIKPLDIVLIHTGADAAWGTSQYLTKGVRHGQRGTLPDGERIKVVASMPGAGINRFPFG
jgi:kynurenine formamidase